MEDPKFREQIMRNQIKAARRSSVTKSGNMRLWDVNDVRNGNFTVTTGDWAFQQLGVPRP